MKMMMKRVMQMPLWLLLVGLAATFTAATAPASCSGRCGEAFARGQQCTCDFSCLLHNECCEDFEAVCTTAQSCRGRCATLFRRGQLCECDPECVRYNTCCHDYQLHCDASAADVPASPESPQSLRAAATDSSLPHPLGNRKSEKNKKRPNSESEEWFKDANKAKSSCPLSPRAEGQGALNPDFLYPLTDSSSGSAPPAAPTNPFQDGMSGLPLSLLPVSGGLSLGSSGSLSPSGPGASGGKLNLQLVLLHGGASQGLNTPAGSRPSTLQDVTQALGASLGEGGLSPNNDLCSDSPIDGLTALSNGTILVFKGELFWSVDPASRTIGHPQSITDTLGVSSPIDTVFTRCNCQGKTYIIKGDQYWRLDSNMAVEPGFPQSLASGFPGLTGGIRAALPVPATRSRPETIYFFKRGDTMQKLSFPSGSAPSCSKKPKNSNSSHLPRQAEMRLSGDINIKVSLKGFPSPVTSALSMPNPQRSDRYEYYAFSGPLFFSIKISGDLPALAKPNPSAAFTAPPSPGSAAMGTRPDGYGNTAARNAKPPRPANSIGRWLQCP